MKSQQQTIFLIGTLIWCILNKQVLNAVSIAPVQVQATPIVSIASIAQPQTQILASSAPIQIATNTSQGHQTVALASTQNLNLSTQQAGQILGTPQITLATGNFHAQYAQTTHLPLS